MDSQNNFKKIDFIEPMECQPVAKLPEGDNWIYELKLDGYRAQAIHDADGLRLLSRNGKDLSKRFPATVSSLKTAITLGTVVDGELVALDAEGRPSFNAMQGAYTRTTVTFYAFDVMMYCWRNIMCDALESRLVTLERLSCPTI